MVSLNMDLLVAMGRQLLAAPPIGPWQIMRLTKLE